MRGGIITIIIIAWILAMAWGLRSFISKSLGTPTQESTTTTTDLMDEQRQKMDQVRQDQKRLMEDLKRRTEDLRR